MRIRFLVSFCAAIALTGCSSEAMPANGVTAEIHAGKPYRLYTHCGIEWARIRGTFWRAARPLSDGNGNPPGGWGNPFEDGSLTFTSRATAKFNSPAGSVIFERTSRTRPPEICS